MVNRAGAGIGVCALLALFGGCRGAADPDKSYLIRHAGVTLVQAASLAEAHVPGRAVRVELKYAGKQVVYEVEILDAGNQPRLVSVDAETGRIVR
jgi:uncharacterized membrane protein YkoI